MAVSWDDDPIGDPLAWLEDEAYINRLLADAPGAVDADRGGELGPIVLSDPITGFEP